MIKNEPRQVTVKVGLSLNHKNLYNHFQQSIMIKQETFISHLYYQSATLMFYEKTLVCMLTTQKGG